MCNDVRDTIPAYQSPGALDLRARRAGHRPVYGGTEKFQSEPHWRDYVLFYEYFHGTTRNRLGASHQTGWTGLIAKIIELYGHLDAERFLEAGKLGGQAPAQATCGRMLACRGDRCVRALMQLRRRQANRRRQLVLAAFAKGRRAGCVAELASSCASAAQQ